MSVSREHPLVLGSASPRRRELLETLGIPLLVRAVETPELERHGEAPEEYQARVVREKLAASAVEFPETGSALLVADTIVVVESRILGKPGGTSAALEMLECLSGRSHMVTTRYALSLAEAPAAARVERSVTTEVRFKRASARELERYAASGEGFDKAGGYAVQGVGGFLVERIEGSYSNVVGLPLCQLCDDLLALGMLADFP